MTFDLSKVVVDRKDVDVVLPEHDGYPEELAKLDTQAAICEAFGDANREFPRSLWIEPKDRAERAKINDEYGLWAGNFIDRYTNQSPTHECTTHAFRAVFEACRNRQRRIALGGPVASKRLPISEKSGSVWMSCVSLYAEANPRQYGGANVQQICRIAIDRGVLPDKVQPKQYNFRHTMQGTCGKGGINQSSGPWPGWSGGDFRNKPIGWSDGEWRETAKNFKPLECVYPRNSDEFDCLLLNGYAIGIGRKGHSVPIVGIKYEGSRKLYPYFDSYDRLLFDSSAYHQGAYAILTTTAPDDWDKPVGDSTKG